MSLQKVRQDLLDEVDITKLKNYKEEIQDKIGVLSQLSTSEKGSLVKAVNEINSQLVEIENYFIDLQHPKNGLTPVSSTGDQTTILQNIINSVPVGKSATLFLNDLTISLDGDITLPKGFSIEGRNAKIILKGMLTLSDDTKLRGFTIDGSHISKYINVNGKRIVIENNVFTNWKNSISGITKVLYLQSTSESVLITNNTFDGIQPYAENGTAGDAEGSTRAILSLAKDVNISNNIFKNMTGYEDGDYIYIETPLEADSSYPFNKNSLTLNQRRTYANTLIDNNIFHQDCKSSIKIAGSGVTVQNNMFFNNYNATSPIYNACVRVYTSLDVIIQNNTMISNGSKLYYFVAVEYCKRTFITGNKMIMRIGLTHANTLETGAVYILYVDYLSISDNEMQLLDMKSPFILYGMKNTVIKNNKMIFNASNLTSVYAIRFGTSTDEKSDNVTFTSNRFESNGATVTLSVGYSDRITLESNDLYRCPNLEALLTNVTFLTLKDNSFNTGKSYVFQISGTCNNFLFIKNLFSGNFNGVIRIPSPVVMTSVKFWENVFETPKDTNDLYIFNTFNNTAQDKNELWYEKGSPNLNFHDYGTNRNGFKKSTGFHFFDTTLGKPIYWNGSVWKDATGTTV